ncbi:hypothetical protein REPUB_Repub03eG0102100 [Reevesia pubescens]
MQANPDMCLVCDRDGRNPVHIVAIKSHLNVLRKLVHARPWAARLLMDEGETILHACTMYNQFEAMKLLVEIVSDHEFVNCKNYDGNTILHLAVADNQIQNVDGFTVLDLLSQNNRNLKDLEIVESFRCVGAVHAKDKPLSNCELKAMRTKILASPTSNQTKATRTKDKDRKRFVKRYDDWLYKDNVPP